MSDVTILLSLRVIEQTLLLPKVYEPDLQFQPSIREILFSVLAKLTD